MANDFQPLDRNFTIVGEDGKPNDYFIRYMQRFLDVAGSVPLSREVIAGTGLAGGGALSADVTLDLDASLGQLNDVDLTTVPPTDGQVMVFNEGAGLWLPADQSGGGGGGGSAWQVISSWDFDVDGAISSLTADVSDCEDVLVIGHAVTASASTWRGGRVSVDGGLNYIDNSWYQGIANNGTISPSDAAMYFHSSASSAARYWHYLIRASKQPAYKSTWSNRGDSQGRIAVTSPITHIQLNPVNSSGNPTGTWTGGRVWVLGRKASGGGGGGGGAIAKYDLSGVSSFDVEDFAGLGLGKVSITVDGTFSNDGSNFVGALKVGGSYLASGYYYQVSVTSSNSSNTNSSHSTSTSSPVVGSGTGGTWGVGNDTGENIALSIAVLSPDEPSTKKSITSSGAYFGATGNLNRAEGAIGANVSGALEGIRLSANSGTFTGRISVYAS